MFMQVNISIIFMHCFAGQISCDLINCLLWYEDNHICL